MASVIALFRESPWFLRIVWSILLVGLLLTCFGFLAQSSRESIAGFSLLAVGYLAGLGDLWLRREQRDEATPFYTGLVFAPVIGAGLLVLFGVLAGITLLVVSWRNGFNQDYAYKLLHFLALLFVFSVITGIPSIARSARAREEAAKAPSTES